MLEFIVKKSGIFLVLFLVFCRKIIPKSPVKKKREKIGGEARIFLVVIIASEPKASFTWSLP